MNLWQLSMTPIKQEVENILDALRAEVEHFNGCGKHGAISYAYGWALSTDYKNSTMRMLLKKADHYMYENKKSMKAMQEQGIQ